MKWLLGFILLMGLSLTGGYIFIKGYPYRTYSQWINGTNWNIHYNIPNYRRLFLKSPPLDAIPPYKEDYVQLWKEFQIRNSLIPLPTRHPLFQTVPLIELPKNHSIPQLGMSILSSTGRELSRIYTLPMSIYKDNSQGQELFKLPYVRNRLLKKSLDEIWRDIFTYEIVDRSKTIEEMIHDLYILHLRSKLLPKETVRYGLIKQGKVALVELVSLDKDYTVELVMTQNNGSIYSYVLKTEKQNPESTKLRSKFLESINFAPIDEAMGRLTYTEFKQLHYNRQTDQEGLLYLFSAWSQSLDKTELIKDMIYYMEKRPKNEKQLSVLYEFAFKKYGKTFSTGKDISIETDPEIALQRKIEIEEIRKRQELDRSRETVPVEPVLTTEEKMNLELKKAKESSSKSKRDMTVH